MLKVTKSYQRIKRQDIITDPKTPKSKRVIAMPDLLVEELREYIDSLSPDRRKGRLFLKTKGWANHEMERGCKIVSLTKIRVHGLRHSHVSLLIDMGFTTLAISDRMGRETVDITYRYAHLFPNLQTDMARALNAQRSF